MRHTKGLIITRRYVDVYGGRRRSLKKTKDQILASDCSVVSMCDRFGLSLLVDGKDGGLL